MKSIKFILFAGFLVMISATVARAQGPSGPVLLVDDDRAQCPTAEFSTIQSAIDAASPGETIRVCAGTYAEQLTIQKTVLLTADNGVTVIPAGVVANANGAGGDNIAAAILVKNATGVHVTGFRVDGSANGLNECSPRLVGVLFQDASGFLAHNAIRHFRLNSTLAGCQSGNAIEVVTSPGSSSQVTINGNSVDDYQKNGITANEAGSSAKIEFNTVTGIGSTNAIAQNGVQIGFGAAGTITGNTVSNHLYAPCVSAAQCDTNAAGILIFESTGVVIASNWVGNNNIGVFSNGDNTHVESNQISNTVALDGVVLQSNGNVALSNNITQSDEASLSFQGQNNHIISNEFLAADIGILIGPGSTGSNHYDNQFYALLQNVVTASADAAAKQAGPLTATANSARVALATAYTQKHVSPSR
ncbi:MAG TPA: right-handed parallel beta-helix repeat-containing protein [Candidatus Acidoferrales bacterium]